jgi:penicillin-binding protein-related factor A (putative recombinase)
MKNRGTSFEKRIADALEIYRNRGALKAHKVDPPTKTFPGGKGRPPRTILLPNPFLDFVGAMPNKGGRMLCFEAKRTEDPRLAIDADRGVTPAQWASLHEWQAAGAACFILWEFPTRTDPFEMRILTLEIAKAALLDCERKSVPWNRAAPVPRGTGYLRYDFMAAIDALT